jgi:hypothetical protein
MATLMIPEEELKIRPLNACFLCSGSSSTASGGMLFLKTFDAELEGAASVPWRASRSLMMLMVLRIEPSTASALAWLTVPLSFAFSTAATLAANS